MENGGVTTIYKGSSRKIINLDIWVQLLTKEKDLRGWNAYD